MIQRKQSIFLLLAALCLIPLYFLPIANYHVVSQALGEIELGISGIVASSDLLFPIEFTYSHIVWPLVVSLSLAVSVPFATIFGYRNRKRQMKWCNASYLFLLVFYAIAFVSMLRFGEQCHLQGTPTLWTILPFLSMVFVFMAKRGIKHDEELIKAADRIR